MLIVMGFNFDKGNVVFVVQVQEQLLLVFKDCDFLRCSQDCICGIDGQIIDCQDYLILQGMFYVGCNNMLQNEVILYYFGICYVFFGDGSMVGFLFGMKLVQ